MNSLSPKLADVAPDLERMLRESALSAPRFTASDIRCTTSMVAMRDGIQLATDIYLPPVQAAPTIVIRTPYGRATESGNFAGSLYAFARRGFAVVSQDCRGTGDSQPDSWDYYMFEAEDGFDCVAWVTRQPWYDGFVGSFGGSYVGQTQWCMATHPAMTTIVPSVSGLGVAVNTAHLYMFLNAYARAMGKGADKVAVPMDQMERHFEAETMAGGFFNDPVEPLIPETLTQAYPQLAGKSGHAAQRFLWETYCALAGAQRAAFVRKALGTDAVSSMDVEAMPAIFGQRISHDALTLPHTDPAALCQDILAPPLMRTGWYDWGLNDALATWRLLRASGRPEVRDRARLIITAFAHNAPGYHVAGISHPELVAPGNALGQVGLLADWYAAVRDNATDRWPTVIYYLMGANEWRTAADWPVPEATPARIFLAEGGALTHQPPASPASDSYVYDPMNPTPTVGGSIVSYLYRPGSADVSAVQCRADILVYTSDELGSDVDMVGPLRMILYAGTSAPDTDFVVRLSDVFPDGRAIQLQSGILRARYRDIDSPTLLIPHQIYRFEIDMWATANRFKAGHRIRIDISSADFPRYDRNSNRGGAPGDPVVAEQHIYMGPEYPSHLEFYMLAPFPDG